MYDVKSTIKAMKAWNDLSLSYGRMMWSASEVIQRRTVQMMLGTMTPEEAARMVLEKPTAFAKGAEMMARAQAAQRGHAEAMLAGLKPVEAKTRSNARRLRRKRA